MPMSMPWYALKDKKTAARNCNISHTQNKKKKTDFYLVLKVHTNHHLVEQPIQFKGEMKGKKWCVHIKKKAILTILRFCNKYLYIFIVLFLSGTSKVLYEYFFCR